MKRHYKVDEVVFEKVTDANGVETYVEKTVPVIKTEEVGGLAFLCGLFKDGPVTIDEKTGEVKKSNFARNAAIAGGLLLAGGAAVYAMSKKNDTNSQSTQPQYPTYPEIPQTQYQPQPTYQIPQQVTAPASETVETPAVSEAPETITFTENYSDGTSHSETIDVTDYDKF